MAQSSNSMSLGLIANNGVEHDHKQAMALHKWHRDNKMILTKQQMTMRVNSARNGTELQWKARRQSCVYISRVLSAHLTTATIDEPRGRFAHCVVINNDDVAQCNIGSSDMVHNAQRMHDMRRLPTHNFEPQFDNF
eukprot:6462452-Amphidinium_carterae.1